MSTSSDSVVNVSVADVVSFLRIEGGFSEALAQVVRRRLLLDAADEADVAASPEELQRAADVYRATHGLHRAADTEAWMKNNGISLEVFEKHLEENIRISKTRDRIAETSGAHVAQSASVRALIRNIAVEEWISRKLAN